MARPRLEHIIDGKQICRRCQINKTIDQFWPTSSKGSGLSQYCKLCSNLNRKETRHRKTDGLTRPKVGVYCKNSGLSKEDIKKYERDRHLKYTYDISLDDYNNLFSEQKGCCAICNTHQSRLKRPLDVDHNHETGKVRGLLCINCNTGLGLFKENLEVLYKVIKYLQKENNYSGFVGDITQN